MYIYIYIYTHIYIYIYIHTVRVTQYTLTKTITLRPGRGTAAVTGSPSKSPRPSCAEGLEIPHGGESQREMIPLDGRKIWGGERLNYFIAGK